MTTATSPISLTQAIARITEAAEHGYARQFDGPSIADGDPYVIRDTGSEEGNVRIFCGQKDLIEVDLPNPAYTDEPDGQDPHVTVELGSVPGLYARLAALLDSE